MKKILVVGGGAVGQVYGWMLRRAGAEIYFYLKPEHKEEARRGFNLSWLSRYSKPRPIHFIKFRTITSPEEVASHQWDQIYLTISSVALRAPWLETFAAAATKTPIIVSLQPGIHDAEYLLRYFSESQLVFSMVPFMAFASPAGNAFYFPPVAVAPVSGPASLAKEVVSILKSGGFPAKYDKLATTKRIAFVNAALIVFVTALENSDWSLKKLGQRESLEKLALAIRQISRCIGREFQLPIPWSMRMVSPWSLKFLTILAPRLVPFDLEAYLKAHFTKVGDQTRLMMEDYIRLGRDLALPTDCLPPVRPSGKLTG
ncbi:MAG: 2-dehydropantoate 2-reductase N-terminal domain-containing protein [Oligoflexia bacterium]|nr:2-dehydropantoate 2-reductase N-terminal domain-containing protein [Oligoflexia bacterium]